MAINRVSEETKEIIRANSVESLPDRPSEKGYGADQLKKYFTNLVLGDVSSLTELDRVVEEVNALIGDIEDKSVQKYVVDTVIGKFVEQAPYVSLKFEDNRLKYTKYGNPTISGELDIIPENSVFFNSETLTNKSGEIIYPVTTLDNVLMGDESIQDLILAVQTRLGELEENHDKDIKTIEDNLNAILGGDAPAALDSIKELAEALKNNPSSIDDILLQLSNLNTNKVDKVSGKSLSTNDYTNEDKSFVETLKTKDVALKTDIKTNLSQMGQDSNYRTVTDDEKNTWNNKANAVHKHEISDVNGLPTALNNKSDVGHTHNIADLGGETSGTSELLVQNHNNSSVAHADIREKINEVENKVNGINNALSFDTTSQLSDWFSGTYNRDDGKKPSDLYVGQYLYIRDQDEDDYWVSTIPANMGNLSVLETDKIDLTEYAKSADLKRVAFTGKYSDLEGKPTIPSTLAELGQDDNHKTITQEKLTQIDTNKTNIGNKLDKSLGSSEANKMLITDASGNVVTAEAGSMAVLVDNLESTSTTMAPTANQVRVLNNKKLDKQLGSENAGKFLKVNDDGIVEPIEEEYLKLTNGQVEKQLKVHVSTGDIILRLTRNSTSTLDKAWIAIGDANKVWGYYGIRNSDKMPVYATFDNPSDIKRFAFEEDIPDVSGFVESEQFEASDTITNPINNYVTKDFLLDYCHPILSYYESDDPTDPSILFGGVWKKIEGVFILSSNDTYPAGSTGGANVHKHFNGVSAYNNKLTISNLNSDSSHPITQAYTVTGTTGFDSVGSVTAFSYSTEEANHMPPYRATNRWQRIA